MPTDPKIPDGPAAESFRTAVETGDAESLLSLLEGDERLRASIDEPLFSFGKPAVVQAAGSGHREVIEILLEFRADIDRLSAWGPGGFGVLHATCFEHPELASWLLERGARVDCHAASGLGDLDRLRQLLEEEPEAIDQRGPDGQFPLHFAANIDVAELLLRQGAQLDARCLDHHSTAAQWALQRAPDVSRYLIEQGARCDIFLAVALGEQGGGR